MSTPNLVIPPDQPWSGAPPKRKGWMARNAVWLIIVAVLLVVGVGVTCVGGIIWSAMGALRDHPATVSAMKQAQEDPRVIAILGTPIDVSRLMQAQFSASGGVTTMTVSCPISGPKGSGTLSFAATQTAGGPWTFSQLSVTIRNGGSVIDLLKPALPAPEESVPPVVPGTP